MCQLGCTFCYNYVVVLTVVILCIHSGCCYDHMLFSGYRGGSRGGYRGGPPSYGASRDSNADRLVDQLQELVGALAYASE